MAESDLPEPQQPQQPSEPAATPVPPAPPAPEPPSPPPAEQAPNLTPSPLTGAIPPVEHRFKPGNRKGGRPPNGGATILEYLNILLAKRCTEQKLRNIAKCGKARVEKRIAAIRLIRAMEDPNMADFEDYLERGLSLRQIQELGVDTRLVKKSKTRSRTYTDKEGGVTVEKEREIELHDRSGDDFDRVLDRTLGRPKQAIDVSSDANLKLTDDGARQDFADRILTELREQIGAQVGSRAAAEHPSVPERVPDRAG